MKKDWKFLRRPEFWVTQIILILITFIGGFFSGKTYYEYYINVEDNHGIIAKTLTVKPPKREINQAIVDALNKNIPKDKAVMVNVIPGDQEAFNFAIKIKEYL